MDEINDDANASRLLLVKIKLKTDFKPSTANVYGGFFYAQTTETKDLYTLCVGF